MLRCTSHRWRSSAAALALLPALLGCPSDEVNERDPAVPEIDLSGVWAGTYTGDTSYAGVITGNWEADVVQGVDGLYGAFTMSGDADCLDGTAAGTIGADGVLGGTLFRYPCNDDTWAMTQLGLLDRTLAGLWTQPALGSTGTFTGLQISRPGGPRIRFVSPLAASPGAIVTIVGTGFDPDPPRNAVDFNGIPAAPPLTASETVLTVRVPASGASGPIHVATPAGVALSPRYFDAAPTHPGVFISATLDLAGRSELPGSVAIDNEGRKAYVTGTAAGNVTIVNTANNLFIATAPVESGWVPLQGIVLSPDARRVHVASGEAGVAELQSALGNVIERIPVPSAGSTLRSPQGLAASPDGATLYVADERDGGAVRVVDLASHAVLATVSRGAGTAPRGVAAGPDGRHAYFVFAGAAEGVDVFDRQTLAVVGALAAGPSPITAAVTPDGRRLYVANELGASVTRWNLETGSSTTISVETQPRGIAVTPDGERLLVANGGSGTLSVIATGTDALLETVRVEPLPMDPVHLPFAVAVSPDGRRAYVSCPESNAVYELGGPSTLTVVKEGSGIGTVTSDPPGISCGPACQARFARGTAVTLRAVAAGGSTFAGWSGDCYGSTVTMDGNRTCTAFFTYVGGTGGGGGGSGGAPSGTGCFIATAAYGSAWEPEVETLRDFRDRYLLLHEAGRAFVRAYYAHSPPFAQWLEGRPWARAVVRWGLAPIVLAIRHPVALLGAAVLMAGGMLRLRKWRQRRPLAGGDP